MLDQNLYITLLIIAACFCLGCIACVFYEVHTAKQTYVQEQALKRRRKLDGLNGPDEPIELIGSRPDDERPAGVDWTISTWGAERGQYDVSNRGYRGV